MSEAVAGRKNTGVKRSKKVKKKASVQNSPERLSGTKEGTTEKIVSGPMDLPFFLIVMVLLIMGIIMMFSAGYAWAIQKGHDGTYYVRNQVAFAAAGLVIMFVVSFFDYHRYRKPFIVFGLYIVSAIMMIMCKYGPFKYDQNGAYRWIKIWKLPAFQPSEIMKLAIILLFAYLISTNYSKLKYFKYGVIPFAEFLAVVMVIMYMQPHISGMIIICAI
jgi:cell division protein FtsW